MVNRLLIQQGMTQIYYELPLAQTFAQPEVVHYLSFIPAQVR
ncbi:hypothetical protein ACWATR_36370 [Nostoc sp. UIC 10890]